MSSILYKVLSIKYANALLSIVYKRVDYFTLIGSLGETGVFIRQGKSGDKIVYI